MTVSDKTGFPDRAVEPFITFDEYKGKPNGEPDSALEDFCVSADWQGRKFEVPSVGNAGGDLEPDLARGHQVTQSLDPLTGTSVPDQNIGSVGPEHGLISSEPGHLSGEVLKGSEVPTADAEENGGSHSSEAGEVPAKRQAGKEVA